jgi:hypothetical protein
VVTPHTAQPNERITLWVRRKGATTLQYASLKGLDAQQTTVEDVKERWANQANLKVTDLSHVTLRLAKCGAHKPTPAEEVASVELDDPSLTLADAGITGTAWLLAETAGAWPGQLRPRTVAAEARRFARGSARRGDCHACCTACVCGGVAELFQRQ